MVPDTRLITLPGSITSDTDVVRKTQKQPPLDLMSCIIDGGSNLFIREDVDNVGKKISVTTACINSAVAPLLAFRLRLSGPPIT